MCNFKAAELLNLRRDIAKNTSLNYSDVCHVIRLIDDARWRHAETTGCRCWEEAVDAHPSGLIPAGKREEVWAQ